MIAQKRLGPGRIHHCMRWLGQGRRAFDMLCERATYRFVQVNPQGVMLNVADSGGNGLPFVFQHGLGGDAGQTDAA